MGFLKWLGDAFSGNIAHWTSTHNPVIVELFKQADTLSENGPKIFKNLIVVSSLSVEQLVFSREGSPLLGVNLESITRNQFDQLYATLLAFLVAKTSKHAPEIGPAIKADLIQVVGQQQAAAADKVFSDIQNASSAESESIRLWDGVTRALGVNEHDIQKQLLLYSVLVQVWLQSQKREGNPR